MDMTNMMNLYLGQSFAHARVSFSAKLRQVRHVAPRTVLTPADPESPVFNCNGVATDARNPVPPAIRDREEIDLREPLIDACVGCGRVDALVSHLCGACRVERERRVKQGFGPAHLGSLRVSARVHSGCNRVVYPIARVLTAAARELPSSPLDDDLVGDDALGREEFERRWDERLARTCRCCGCRSIGDDGVCDRCGSRKAPPGAAQVTSVGPYVPSRGELA
jgi:hypothetical protein